MMGVAEAKRLRQSVEKILFTIVFSYVVVAVTIKSWMHIRSGIERANVHRRMTGYKEFVEDGEELDLPEYFDYVGEYVQNVMTGGVFDERNTGMNAREGVITRINFHALGRVVSGYDGVLAVMNVGPLELGILSLAVNRLFGRCLSTCHEDDSYWMSTKEYKYLNHFKPSGLEGRTLKLSIGGVRKTMSVDAHVTLVMLQYIEDSIH